MTLNISEHIGADKMRKVVSGDPYWGLQKGHPKEGHVTMTVDIVSVNQ